MPGLLAATTELDLPVSLALFDFVPVALSALAVALIARHVERTRPERALEAKAGAALVVAGGLAKAVWKLLEAADIADLGWMADLLFVLLAPGFVLLASSLTRHRVVVVGAVLPLGAAANASDPLAAVIQGALLVLTIVASTVLVVLLARAAGRDGQRTEARMMWGALALMFSLGPLAGAAEQSVNAQWAEEVINSGAQGLLALAMWRWSLRPSAGSRPDASTTDAVSPTAG